MPVPNTFANATATIPLSQLDANFATTITLGNTAIQLGNTVTTLNNMTLANVTVTSGNVTITNVTVTTANVTTANIATANVTTSQILNYGTANGVAYLNTSKVLTTGTALTFDGSTFAVTGAATVTGDISTTSTGRLNVRGSGTGINNDFQIDNSDTLVNLRGSRSNAITKGFVWYLNNSTTEGMRLDSSGNLGLGVTPSAWGSTFKAFQIGTTGSVYSSGTAALANNFYVDSGGTNRYLTSSFSTVYLQNSSGQHAWFNAASGTAGNAITFTQAMTLDASGNLGLNNSAPTSLGANYRTIEITAGSVSAGGGYYLTSNGTTTGQLGVDGTGVYVGSRSNHICVFTTNNTERARITSGGFFKSSNTGTYIGSTGAYHELISDSTNSVAYIRNTNASPTGLDLSYSAASPNGTGNPFLYCQDSTALRASIRSNGGLANYSANNVNLSDRREKTNFAPAKNYIDVICAIPVQTFNYLDQNVEDDPGLTLGVVAQDVQEVAPELVMESNWGTEEEPKMRLSIYQTDLQYALMKCIQELNAKVEAQAAEIAALKAQP